MLIQCRFRNFSVSKLFKFFEWYRIHYQKNLVSKKVSDSVSEKIGIEKSIGFVIRKIWYQKKYRIRYQKKFGIEKVLESVSKIFGIEKNLDSVLFRFWVSSHTGSSTQGPSIYNAAAFCGSCFLTKAFIDYIISAFVWICKFNSSLAAGGDFFRGIAWRSA